MSEREGYEYVGHLGWNSEHISLTNIEQLMKMYQMIVSRHQPWQYEIMLKLEMQEQLKNPNINIIQALEEAIYLWKL